MADDALRRSMAAAIRTVLEEGLLRADDPIAYLCTVASEVRQIVSLFEEETVTYGNPNGSMVRAILAEVVEVAAREMIGRLQH